MTGSHDTNLLVSSDNDQLPWLASSSPPLKEEDLVGDDGLSTTKSLAQERPRNLPRNSDSASPLKIIIEVLLPDCVRANITLKSVLLYLRDLQNEGGERFQTRPFSETDHCERLRALYFFDDSCYFALTRNATWNLLRYAVVYNGAVDLAASWITHCFGVEESRRGDLHD